MDVTIMNNTKWRLWPSLSIKICFEVPILLVTPKTGCGCFFQNGHILSDENHRVSMLRKSNQIFHVSRGHMVYSQYSSRAEFHLLIFLLGLKSLSTFHSVTFS